MKVRLSKRVLTWDLVRRFVFVGLVLSFIYVGYSTFFADKDKVFAAMLSKKMSTLDEEESKDKFSNIQDKDYSLFLREVENKNVFKLPHLKQKLDTQKIDRNKLESVINNLRLVGILWRKAPKAIIEDSRKKDTFYLSQGQSFLDDIMIEKIDKNSVVLYYKGQRFELGL